ncbi:HNH endonuclease [Streptomyces mirabilis]|uniref:HNH endonuclease n=1 Tax=Streptomyces mirabilis TaxID=68239 RepID=UPI00340064FB
MNDPTGAPSESKACTGCGTVKPLTDFTFDKRHADGRQSRCKACFNAYKKQYRERDREHYLELRRLEHERRRDKIREAARAYLQANRDEIYRKAKERRESLTGEALEEFRRYHRERSLAYRQRNPEACAERVAAWRRENRDKVLDYFHRRRARQMGNGEVEAFARREIGDRDGWVCGICKEPIDALLAWPDRYSPSIDHIVPLVYGGTHTRANVRITHVICNVRRGADRSVYQTDGTESVA